MDDVATDIPDPRNEPMVELVVPAVAPVDPPTAQALGPEVVVEYAPPRPPPSLRASAIRGSLWTIVGFGLAQIIRFGSNLILTRNLRPDTLALAAIAGTIIAGLYLFSDLGIGPSIIQHRRGDAPPFFNTAWTISILRGMLTWLVASALAWPVSRYCHQPLLCWVLLTCACNPLINGFCSTSIFTLNRHLALGRITLLNTGTQLLSTAIMLLIAWRYHSVWSIVVGGLSGSLLTTVLSHLLIPGQHNRLAWDKESLGQLITPFAGWILVGTMLMFFANYIDRLLLLKLVDMGVIGVYYTATTLVSLPTGMIACLTGMMVFPALARSAQEPSGVLRGRFYRSRALILPAGVAGTLTLSLGAPVFFGVLYTRSWFDAGWMAQFMAIGAWGTILQATADRTLVAVGHTRPLAFSNAANMAVTVVGAFAGYYLGEHYFNHRHLEGFILGVAAGNFAGLLVVQIAMARIGVPIHRQDLRYTLLVTAATAAGLLLRHPLARLVPQHHGLLPQGISATLVVGAASAWAAARIWKWIKTR